MDGWIDVVCVLVSCLCLSWFCLSCSEKEEKEIKRSLGFVILRGENIISLTAEAPPPSGVRMCVLSICHTDRQDRQTDRHHTRGTDTHRRTHTHTHVSPRSLAVVQKKAGEGLVAGPGRGVAAGRGVPVAPMGGPAAGTYATMESLARMSYVAGGRRCWLMVSVVFVVVVVVWMPYIHTYTL